MLGTIIFNIILYILYTAAAVLGLAMALGLLVLAVLLLLSIVSAVVCFIRGEEPPNYF